MPKVNIDVKNKGILEVPKDKKVDELPLKHFEDLVDKKGYDKIIKALNNLQVWNKNDDKELSKWAEDTMEALKKKFRPEEVESSAKISDEKISELVNKHAPHNRGWKWEPNHKAITVYFKDVHSSYAEDEWDALLKALYPKFLSDVMVANSAKKSECSFKVGDKVKIHCNNPEDCKKVFIIEELDEDEKIAYLINEDNMPIDYVNFEDMELIETSSKHYIVHESIGNFSDKVFESDDFYEVQDYLEDRWVKYCEDERVGLDDEKERELFDSYFHIEEIQNASSTSDWRDIVKQNFKLIVPEIYAYFNTGGLWGEYKTLGEARKSEYYKSLESNIKSIEDLPKAFVSKINSLGRDLEVEDIESYKKDKEALKTFIGEFGSYFFASKDSFENWLSNLNSKLYWKYKEEKEVENSMKIDTDLDKYVGIGYEDCIIDEDTKEIAKDFGFEPDEPHRTYYHEDFLDGGVLEYQDGVKSIFFVVYDSSKEGLKEEVLLHTTPREAFKYALEFFKKQKKVENSMIDNNYELKIGDTVRFKDGYSGEYVIEGIQYDDEEVPLYSLYNKETGEDLEYLAYAFELVKPENFEEPEEELKNSDKGFHVGDKVKIKAYPEKVYTIQDFDGETYKLKELGFSRYSEEELELACDKMKLSKVAKALSKVGIETSAKEDEEILNTVTKSKVRKALDAIFPACDKDIRFPEKTIFKKEAMKQNLDKNKKHEYLAQSSKVAQALKKIK